jgi:hypothetical protein
MTVFEEASFDRSVWNAALRALVEGFRAEKPNSIKRRI